MTRLARFLAMSGLALAVAAAAPALTITAYARPDVPSLATGPSGQSGSQANKPDAKTPKPSDKPSDKSSDKPGGKTPKPDDKTPKPDNKPPKPDDKPPKPDDKPPKPDDKPPKPDDKPPGDMPGGGSGGSGSGAGSGTSSGGSGTGTSHDDAAREEIERSREPYRPDPNGPGNGNRSNLSPPPPPPLAPGDAGCVANVNPVGMPLVPSKCAAKAECRQCFAEAYTQLGKIRTTFEKLKCIYTTTKDISSKATSFGDNVSSIHGVQGMAWQVERRKIEKALDQLNKSYDAKYSELMGKLGQDLKSIGTCEKQFYGDDEWYGKFGYMFYSFMAERYKR